MSTSSSSLVAFLAWTPFDALHQIFDKPFAAKHVMEILKK
jgi:hypothetical protein